MKIDQLEKTKNSHIVVSNLDQRLYIEGANGQQIWVATNYGDIQIGIGDDVYRVVDGELIKNTDKGIVDNPYRDSMPPDNIWDTTPAIPDSVKVADFVSPEIDEQDDEVSINRKVGDRMGCWVWSGIRWQLSVPSITQENETVLPTSERRIKKALSIAYAFASTYGREEKVWVLDQIVRALTGCGASYAYADIGESQEYLDFVANFEKGDEVCKWNTGVVP